MNDNYLKARDRAAAICSKTEKCTSDINIYLKKFDISENEIAEIVNYLVSNNYINEQRFANAYVKDKLLFNHWGCQKIIINLRAKKISTEIINLAIQNAQPEKEIDIAFAEIQKKLKSIKYNSINELKTKLLRFCASRGYTQQVAINQINKALSDLK